MRKLGDPRVEGVRQWGQLIAGSTAVPVSPICLRRMKSFKHACRRVGGEPEREVFMCAGEGLEEEVRVLLRRGRREVVAHLV